MAQRQRENAILLHTELDIVTQPPGTLVSSTPARNAFAAPICNGREHGSGPEHTQRSDKLKLRKYSTNAVSKWAASYAQNLIHSSSCCAKKARSCGQRTSHLVVDLSWALHLPCLEVVVQLVLARVHTLVTAILGHVVMA
jgi:hypothetical protein